MNREPQTIKNAPALADRVRSFIANGDTNDDAFNALALDVFAFQFETVPIYRSFCHGRSVGPGSVAYWPDIPSMPTSAFKEFELSSIPKEERTVVFHSSGTTAQIPSRHFHNRTSLSLYEASLLSWFERHMRPKDTTFLLLTPPPHLAPHSSLAHMFEIVTRQFAGANFIAAGSSGTDGSWALNFEALDRAVSGGHPMMILGTAFLLVHWLDRLAGSKKRLRLPNGSCVMETGGYKGRSRVVAKAELRRLITRHLGIPESHIITEYGMSELSSQAYDGVVSGVNNRIFHFPPWARTLVVSPETGQVVSDGEIGLLRIFDLANLYSVMAVQTEDLAVSRGDGFELLGRAEAAEPRGCSLMAAS